MSYHEYSLDTLCAGLCYALGIDAPTEAAAANPQLTAYLDATLGKGGADRIFMYNPDAVATWIYEKYPQFLRDATVLSPLALPMCTVMPSVTPVCFGTMYTGTQPAVHGIRKYEKPVIRVDSIFDALIRAGKKPVIIAENNCSMSKIYLERDMDYFFYDTVAEVNAKTAELIAEDKYDFYAVYNGNYDSVMHKNGPEAPISLAQAAMNAQAYASFVRQIQNMWSGHRTLYGFAMDHGCHEIDGDCGSHGLDMEEDLNITHLYGTYPEK